MNMTEMKIADLIGPALDWAVAKSLGWQMFRVPKDIDGNFGGEVLAPSDLSKDFQFPPRGDVPVGYFLRRWSTDWAQCGPLIEKHAIEFEWVTDATIRAELPSCASFGFGETHLIAACRSIVAAKIGDVVSVPAELVGGGV